MAVLSKDTRSALEIAIEALDTAIKTAVASTLKERAKDVVREFRKPKVT